MVRFWTACLFFHALLLGYLFWRGWSWRERLRKPRPGALWVLDLLSEGVVFAAGLLFLGLVLGMMASGGPFSALRLVGQGLFGEGTAALILLALLHFRAGGKALTWRGAVLAAGAIALGLLYWEAYHRCPYDL